ncbi:Mpv17/PMP22 [Dillenia turbinata]|uniref:Mpv17/PMP22 n=1 Tax=Dillenia turbinata TaxID=194707 RepID=A0AAN8ZF69_9MAGN
MARALISKRFPSISIESPLFINLRNYKAYTQPLIHNHITKHRFPSISHPQFSLSYSSSSSKVGFVGWYLAKIESRPLITKSITSSLIYTAADLTSQAITVQPSDSFDFKRTLRMAGFGMFILGPSQHAWFNFVANVLPRQDMVTILKKLLMGQVIYGPSINSVFFSLNAALQGESAGDIVARLKRDLLPTLRNGLLYWPVCDFFTFKFVPVHLQPLMNSSFAYIWTIYLTYMANLKKVGIERS